MAIFLCSDWHFNHDRDFILAPRGFDTIEQHNEEIIRRHNSLAVTFAKDGKKLKCLYGGTTDYQKIKNQLKTIRKKFPDAFIVAYLGEKSITTAEALKIINEKKK